MMRALSVTVLVVTLLALPAMAAKDRIMTKQYPAIVGNEPLPDVPYFPTHPGAITQSPGDTVGWTQYDIQSIGSSGNRVAVDSLGGVHFTWMNANSYPMHRYVFYNYRSPLGDWTTPAAGCPVSDRNRDGYPQIAITRPDRAAIAFHNPTTGAESLSFAVDYAPGMGAFSIFQEFIKEGNSHFK